MRSPIHPRKREGVNKFLSSSQSKMGNKDKLARDRAIRESYKIRDSEGNRLYTQEKLSEIVGLHRRSIFTIVSEEENP